MKGRAVKTIQFKTESFDEDEGIFSGYGAVFGNVDSGGDIIEHGAFTKTLAKGWERVKILALHNDAILPIGRPIELREDENGLYLKAKISDTATGRDVKTLIKDGVLSELSIGYDPIIFEFDENQIRHLKELELFEISVVTWAMNEQALITDYKSLDRKAAEFRETVELLDMYLKRAAERLDAAAGRRKEKSAKRRGIVRSKDRKSREIIIIRR